MIKIKLVTPAIAKELLRTNKSNRVIQTGRVESYKRQMLEGLWKFNGETISISKDGMLLNGQHRLLAIIASGVSIQMIIVEGIDADAFSTIDQGMTRSAGQIFSMAGIKNANSMSSIVNQYLLVKDTKVVAGRTSKNLLNKNQLIECYSNKKALFDNAYHTSMKLYDSINRCIKVVPTAVIICMLSEVDEDYCNHFFNTLITPEYLSKNHPCFILRNTLMRHPKPEWRVLYSHFIKSWNAFLRNQDIKILKYNPEIELPKILSK
jgi:hypothetical protein